MKCFELTNNGLIPGLPITLGAAQKPNRVRLGEGQFTKTSRRLADMSAYASINIDLFYDRDADRILSCDVLFGDMLQLHRHSGKTPVTSVLLLVSYFARQPLSFFTEGDCEILTEAPEKEHGTQVPGKTALVRLGPGGVFRIAEGVPSSTDPRFVRRIALDSRGEPVCDALTQP